MFSKRTEIDLNECEHCTFSRWFEIDLNECEHFLKGNLDWSNLNDLKNRSYILGLISDRFRFASKKCLHSFRSISDLSRSISVRILAFTFIPLLTWIDRPPPLLSFSLKLWIIFQCKIIYFISFAYDIHIYYNLQLLSSVEQVVLKPVKFIAINSILGEFVRLFGMADDVKRFVETLLRHSVSRTKSARSHRFTLRHFVILSLSIITIVL